MAQITRHSFILQPSEPHDSAHHPSHMNFKLNMLEVEAYLQRSM